MEFKQAIQNTIIDYKTKNSISRATMARHLGVPVTTLQAWEDGRSLPNAEKFTRLLLLTRQKINDFPVELPQVARSN